MIKLNNKNITYVALADSNNSLKAPKEIWYADTNNSVKLVYRRKDALIEGEDYEKYHWLKVDGTARISTNETISSTDKVECVIKPTDTIETSNRWQYIYCNNGGDNDFTFMFVLDNPTSMYFRHYRAVSVYTPNDIYTIEHSINSVSVNGIQLGHISENQYVETDRKLGLFCAGDNPYVETTHIYTGYIGEFKLIDKLSLIPCKLLKPVPKWLDANGIRRQVGECGMIDLVSGKFYGNVNSVGTFTVENYYERKEWLVGDGSAYISGITYNLWDNHLVSQVYNINKKYVQFVQSDINNSDRNISMTRNSVYLQIIFRELSQTNTTHIADLNPNDFSGAIDLDYYISDSNFNVKVNGVTYTNASGVYATESKWKSFNGLSIYSEMMSYIREITPSGIYVSNLIPCTLTMDLPASMDANGIARTSGECGMWDLVSDKFYGNVANSGTFKAVNLAEGVDYEVHQWLGSASGFPYIEVQDGVNTDENAYIETTYKCNYSNGGFDMVVGFSINQDSNIGIRIFNATYGTAYGTYVDYHKTVNGVLSSCRMVAVQSNINAERYIKATLNNLIIDTTEYSSINWGSGFDNVNYLSTRLLGNQDNNNVMYKRTKIRANFKEYDLVPCKLLKSIPAKYDGNGIARQAGECGMYDTVSGKFFGNVANRGTFSVSD